MHYLVYLIGKKVNKYYMEIIQEYQKRLSRYCRIQLIRIKDQEQLSRKLAGREYKIVVSHRGQLISSEELADKINFWAMSNKSPIAIIIGAENVTGDETLAISPMEMEPGLIAAIVSEQIYRAYRIINNEPYHK